MCPEITKKIEQKLRKISILELYETSFYLPIQSSIQNLQIIRKKLEKINFRI